MWMQCHMKSFVLDIKELNPMHECKKTANIG